MELAQGHNPERWVFTPQETKVQRGLGTYSRSLGKKAVKLSFNPNLLDSKGCVVSTMLNSKALSVDIDTDTQIVRAYMLKYHASTQPRKVKVTAVTRPSSVSIQEFGTLRFYGSIS